MPAQKRKLEDAQRQLVEAKRQLAELPKLKEENAQVPAGLGRGCTRAVVAAAARACWKGWEVQRMVQKWLDGGEVLPCAAA